MAHTNYIDQSKIFTSVPVHRVPNTFPNECKSNRFPINFNRMSFQPVHLNKISNVTYGIYSDPTRPLKATNFSNIGSYISPGFFRSHVNLLRPHSNAKIAHLSYVPLFNHDHPDKNLNKRKFSGMSNSFSDEFSQDSIDVDYCHDDELGNESAAFLCSTLTEQEDEKKSDVSDYDLNMQPDADWHKSKQSTFSVSHNFLTPKMVVSENSDSCEDTEVLDMNNEDNATEKCFISPSKCIMPKSLMIYYNTYQRLDLPMTALGKPHFIQTYAQNGEICLENVWEAHMKLLFRNVSHKWVLHSLAFSEVFDSSYFCFKDFAKVRFYCQHCMDGWTSMCGMVLFFYRVNEETKIGDIYFQILGQKCGRCNPDFFEMPLWYPEEVQKVITNLYYDVASRIYGFQTPLPIRTRRMGQPVNHHNASLCQGCHQGFCKRGGNQNLTEGEPNKIENKDSSVSSPYYGSYNIPSCSDASFVVNPCMQFPYTEYNRYVPYCCAYSPAPYIPYSEYIPQFAFYYPNTAY